MVVTPADSCDYAELSETLALCGLHVDLSQEFARDCARLWVARLHPADQQVAGVLLAWIVVDELHIIDLGTRPDCRRQGVARSLLAAVLDDAVNHRVRLAVLEVRRSNVAAIRLYATAGFCAVAVRKGYYSNPVEDALLMQLALDSDTGRRLPAEHEVPLIES